MDSGFRPLLSGENDALQKMRNARQFSQKIQRYRIVIPAKAGRSAQRGEHPKDGPEGVSEANHPVPLTLCKSLDPSFRWDDERFSHFCKTCRHFPRTAMRLRRNDGVAFLSNAPV
jgi:hypothetical protein